MPGLIQSRSIAVSVWVLHGPLDVVATLLAKHRGPRWMDEANPITRELLAVSPAAFAVTKLLVVSAVAILVHRSVTASDRSPLASVFVIIWIGLGIIAVASNLVVATAPAEQLVHFGLR